MDEVNRIKQLKKDKNAIILAHNYQRGEVQDIADFVGDSFGLSQKAVDSGAETIVFCGVDFMAESAKIFPTTFRRSLFIFKFPHSPSYSIPLVIFLSRNFQKSYIARLLFNSITSVLGFTPATFKM